MKVADLDLSHPSLSLLKTDWGLLKAALYRRCLQIETVFKFLYVFCVNTHVRVTLEATLPCCSVFNLPFDLALDWCRTYSMLCLRQQLVLPEHGREVLLNFITLFKTQLMMSSMIDFFSQFHSLIWFIWNMLYAIFLKNFHIYLLSIFVPIVFNIVVSKLSWISCLYCTLWENVYISHCLALSFVFQIDLS